MNECSEWINSKRQLLLEQEVSDHKIVLAYGGSRSGKTAKLCQLMVYRAFRVPSRHVILRFHFTDVKTSVGLDTMPKVLKLMGIPYELNKSDWFFKIQCADGKSYSEIWLSGLDDKERVDRILGREYSTIYFNEASQISYHAYTTALTRLAENSGLNNKVFIDCNPPEKSHWLYKMFVLHKQPNTDMDLQKPEMYSSILMNPTDNPHLPKDYIADTLETLPDRQKRRFLYGEWLDKRQGALWTTDIIERNRVSAAPAYLSRVVIGVDPAVTSKEDSDETGIVAVGMDGTGNYYVLRDASGKFAPVEWAKIAVDLYKQYQADAIVAETNQGGDMVESTVRTIDHTVNYRGVRASRGKVLRAEPIEALYEQNKVHHAGYFPELETQMTEWTPTDNYSPDRLDACIHGLTDLLQSGIIYGAQPNNPTVATGRQHYNFGGSSYGGYAPRTRPPVFGNGFGRGF